MATIVFQSLLLAGIGIAGLVSGWFLRRGITVTSQPVEPNEDDLKPEAPTPEAAGTAKVLTKLNKIVESISFDVEEHNESVEDVTKELQLMDLSDTESVVAVVARLVGANNKLQHQLTSAEARLQDQAKIIQVHVRDARTDPLTSVANRRAFDSEINEGEQSLSAAGEPMTVMMMDVDYFKKINDVHGHLAGDEMLKHVANLIKRKTRREGMVCRYGGEEFALVFRNKSIHEVLELADRVRDSVGESGINFEGKFLKVTMSAGIAELKPSESALEMVGRADDALIMAKQNGRDQAYWNDGAKSIPVRPEEPEEQTSITIETDTSDSQSAGKTEEGVPLVKSEIRRLFIDDVARRIAEWKRGGSVLTTMVVALDDFRYITTSLHEDDVKLIMATTDQFLNASMRDMDHVAFIDENCFGMLLPCTAMDSAVAVAERLRSAIEKCRIPQLSRDTTFTISIGIASVKTGDTAEKMLERSVKAVNHAQEKQGNRLVSHDGEALIEMNPSGV